MTNKINEDDIYFTGLSYEDKTKKEEEEMFGDLQTMSKHMIWGTFFMIMGGGFLIWGIVQAIIDITNWIR